MDVHNERNSINDFLTLVLYVTMQKLDPASEWKPMFDMTPDPQSLLDCPPSLLDEDESLVYLKKMYWEFVPSVYDKVTAVS